MMLAIKFSLTLLAILGAGFMKIFLRNKKFLKINYENFVRIFSSAKTHPGQVFECMLMHMRCVRLTMLTTKREFTHTTTTPLI